MGRYRKTSIYGDLPKDSWTALLSAQRRVHMEFFLFPSKDKGGFWKQVDEELEALEKDVNTKATDERPQAWAE